MNSLDRVTEIGSLISGLKVVLASLAAVWLGLPGALQLLAIMQALDVLSGILAAGQQGDYQSYLAWRGIRKKAFAWLIVLAVNALQTQLQFPEVVVGLSPAEVTASYFAIVVEGGSILENAYRAGVPIPTFITNWLKVAQEQFGDMQTIEIEAENIRSIETKKAEGRDE